VLTHQQAASDAAHQNRELVAGAVLPDPLGGLPRGRGGASGQY